MLSLVKRSILHSIPITRHILPIQLILVKMNHVQIRNIKLYHFISYGFMLTKLTVFLFNLFSTGYEFFAGLLYSYHYYLYKYILKKSKQKCLKSIQLPIHHVYRKSQYKSFEFMYNRFA